MLVLNRRKNESVMIDGDIKIKVLQIKGNQVSIGIEAPKEVLINREEVHKKIKESESPSLRSGFA